MTLLAPNRDAPRRRGGFNLFRAFFQMALRHQQLDERFQVERSPEVEREMERLEDKIAELWPRVEQRLL